MFKSDTASPELLPQDRWWKVNMITCAAPNLRPDRDGRFHIQISNQELYELHVKRMRRILNIAAMHGNDVMILGAYGCGALRNPPEVVASAMKQVAQEYRYHFQVIEFPVYCAPYDERNYQVFRKIFEK